MTSKEMKLVKFETLIRELWKRMIKFSPGEGSPCCNPLNILFGEEWKDEYGAIVVKNTFVRNIEEWNVSGSYTDVKTLVETSKRTKNTLGWGEGNLGAQTVFFGLIVLAIDSDSYNEKLSILTDFAYLVGFNEDMISDFVYSVKAVLSAEKSDIGKMKSMSSRQFLRNIM